MLTNANNHNLNHQINVHLMSIKMTMFIIFKTYFHGVILPRAFYVDHKNVYLIVKQFQNHIKTTYVIENSYYLIRK